MVQKLIAGVPSKNARVAERAAAALVELGASGGRAVIAAIQSNPSRSPDRLLEVLLAMEDPELVPSLCELMDSPSFELYHASFTLLGRLGDERALPPLVRALDTETSPTSQRLAARALGEMGRDGAEADGCILRGRWWG